jgi:hypothetical protein
LPKLSRQLDEARMSDTPRTSGWGPRDGLQNEKTPVSVHPSQGCSQRSYERSRSASSLERLPRALSIVHVVRHPVLVSWLVTGLDNVYFGTIPKQLADG